MKGTVIEKEGRFYKECGVVMLDSNNPSHIYLVTKTNKLGYVTGKDKEDLEQFPQTVIETQNQHLYITSDDDIKVGDWYFDYTSQAIRQCEDEHRAKLLQVAKHLSNRKIIASTDTSLGLPSPSDKFIQAYIDAYNKGEKIEKVLVEYHNNSDYNPTIFPDIRLKFKDNNIIIKKVKDSWECNRSQLLKLTHDVADALNGEDSIGFDLEKWIDENL